MTTGAVTSEEEGDNIPVGGTNVDDSDNETFGTADDDNDSGSGGSVATATATMSTITVGGMKITVAASKVAVSVDDGVTLKKEERAKMRPDKRMELFNRIAYECEIKLSELTSTNLTEAALEDAYDLQNTILMIKNHYKKYDMVHPFCNVVLFDANDDEDDTNVDWQNPKKKVGSQDFDLKNVFEDYGDLTLKQVARSNEWYRTMPSDTTMRNQKSQAKNERR